LKIGANGANNPCKI